MCLFPEVWEGLYIVLTQLLCDLSDCIERIVVLRYFYQPRLLSNSARVEDPHFADCNNQLTHYQLTLMVTLSQE